MKIIEINPSIKKLVDANGGYCPSIEKQNKGTMCVCQEFRDMVYAGRCRCGRYEKVLEDEDIRLMKQYLTEKKFYKELACEFNTSYDTVKRRIRAIKDDIRNDIIECIEMNCRK